ncbi:hypothetical protein BDV23DRAFT_152848, partial [Aspergillus alliaceus]
MAATQFSIRLASPEHAPILGKISGDSFLNDRHTQMKGLGKDPYDLERSMAADIPRQATSPNIVLLEAVDSTSGEVAGWVSWGFRGFTPAEVAAVRPGELFTFVHNSSEKGERGEEKPAAKDQDDTSSEVVEGDPIKRLEAMTGADLKRWMDKVMPDGTKCMFVISLCVAPKWQSRGVGSLLLQWGTDTADSTGVFMWVHSSAGAWQMYRSHGFETIEKLDVDLDQYAPAPPPDNEEIWGHYVFRYMIRLPQGSRG